ncbi:hypothetical protein ACFLZB_03240 [Nanoarchaeota archaeon]
MSSFIDDVILKPTGLWGMFTCGLGTAYTFLEPIYSNLASGKAVDNLETPLLFALGFGLSALMYYSSNHTPSLKDQS